MTTGILCNGPIMICESPQLYLARYTAEDHAFRPEVFPVVNDRGCQLLHFGLLVRQRRDHLDVLDGHGASQAGKDIAAKGSDLADLVGGELANSEPVRIESGRPQLRQS